jgi:protein SCO1/2
MTLRHFWCATRWHLALAALAIFLTADRSALADFASAPRGSPPLGAARPPALAEIGIEEHLGAALPTDLAFRDHTGASVQLDRYFDRRRPVLVNLMYHRCAMLCSVVLDGLTSALKEVEWRVGEEFDIVTISIDPRDGPDIATRKRQQILARYGRREAERGWHFLTGNEAAISRVASALGFVYRWDPEQQQYAHPAAVFLLTPDGRIARYLYGVEFVPRDLRFGLLEASEGRSVSTVERVLLFCYHYDATGRRYTFLVTRVLRVGGVALVLLVGALLTRMWRSERRRRT